MEIILSVRSVRLIGVIEVNFIDVIDMLREKTPFLKTPIIIKYDNK